MSCLCKQGQSCCRTAASWSDSAGSVQAQPDRRVECLACASKVELLQNRCVWSDSAGSVQAQPDRQVECLACASNVRAAAELLPPGQTVQALRRHNQIDGQRNLRDAVRRSISFTDPKSGKSYQLKGKVSLLPPQPCGACAH